MFITSNRLTRKAVRTSYNTRIRFTYLQHRGLFLRSFVLQCNTQGCAVGEILVSATVLVIIVAVLTKLSPKLESPKIIQPKVTHSYPTPNVYTLSSFVHHIN